jgi:hypothetical protein
MLHAAFEPLARSEVATLQKQRLIGWVGDL